MCALSSFSKKESHLGLFFFERWSKFSSMLVHNKKRTVAMKKRHILLSCGIVSLLMPVLGYGFEQADLDTLLRTNECVSCDLTEANLAGKTLTKAKLNGVDLTGANLTNTILRMADLAGANFTNADLTHTVFEAADLYKANFEGANFDGTIFDGAYIVGALFDGELSVKGQDTHVSKVDVEPEVPVALKGQKVAQGSIAKPGAEVVARVEFVPPSVGAVLLSASDSAALDQSINALIQLPGGVGINPNRYMPDPSLNIKGFKPLVEDDESEADGVKTMFPLSKNDLLDQVDDSQMCVGCDFASMDLAGTKFKAIYLEGVNFEGANLEGVNFREANLKGANLRNANLKNADLREADLYKADLAGANLAGADLRDALLAGADLTGATLDGAMQN